MVGFADQFKSLVNQAQQKITEIQSNEQLKGLVGQVQEKVSEYSDLAQTRLEEYKANSEKQRLETAATHASNHKYQKAINTLKAIPASSELYEEAQQKIVEYVNASAEYVIQQATQMTEQGLYNEAIASLKAIPEEAASYLEAQKKISEYVNAFESLIKKHRNLTPILYSGRIIAAAFVDQTIHSIGRIERSRLIYNSLGNTYADGEFLIIRLIVRNDSKKARTISASMMNIIDSQEREYSVSNKGTTALQMNGDQTVEFLASEIQPGLQKTITIVFDVPAGANNLSLKVPSSGWGGSAILPLSLAV